MAGETEIKVPVADEALDQVSGGRIRPAPPRCPVCGERMLVKPDGTPYCPCQEAK